MDLATPARFIPHVGPVFARRLAKLAIYTVADLLWHLPSRYEDYRITSEIARLQEGEQVTVIVTVRSIKNIFLSSGKQLQKALVYDTSGEIEVVWYNQPFLVKILAPSMNVALTGKVYQFNRVLNLQSPEYEIVKDKSELVSAGRLVPIYPETQGISSKWLRTRIHELLALHLFKEYLPQHLILKYHLLPIDEAIRLTHFPVSPRDPEKGKLRLAFDELIILELRALQKRLEWARIAKGKPILIPPESLKQFIGALPFTLTPSQLQAIDEIVSDLSKPHSMNRLLQGDVGSGKTVVAAVAMYIASLNGARSILMAPTEILALQHFETLKRLFVPFRIRVGIQTASNKTFFRTKNSNLKKAADDFDILVGTHALLENHVSATHVGLVVIDEQHRFGVRQRSILRKKGANPHVLTMTATPIPRTIALTLHGDLELSQLEELPSGRKRIKTWVVPENKRIDAYRWISRHIKESDKKNRTFIICPFIEPSESLTTVKAAVKEFTHLSEKIFPDVSLGLLHGKLHPKEKLRILNDFRMGNYQILVSTPVVEVGIDIPEATIILIEGADRFGLAQLHQLRGRVGRGEKQSYCLLFSSTSQENARLKSLERIFNGAQLAELDLKLRGPGSYFGTLQHGQIELKAASYCDFHLIQTTLQEAKILIREDAQLSRYPLLKQRVLSDTIQEVTPD